MKAICFLVALFFGFTGMSYASDTLLIEYTEAPTFIYAERKNISFGILEVRESRAWQIVLNEYGLAWE